MEENVSGCFFSEHSVLVLAVAEVRDPAEILAFTLKLSGCYDALDIHLSDVHCNNNSGDDGYRK